MSKDNRITYKGFPIMKYNNEYYYGHASDPYFILMTVMSYTKIDGTDVPDNISITLMSGDTSLPLPQRMVRRADKKGLSEALQLSHIWLSRELPSDTNETTNKD